MKRKILTIADIRSKYTEEKRNFEKNSLWCYHVLRGISYFPAWLFLRLGISANKVTGIALIIGCIGCIFLAFGSYCVMIAGALLVNIWALLDQTDGDIARYNNSCTNYGGFIDGLAGNIIAVLLFVSSGIGVFLHPDPSFNIIINSFSAIDINPSIYLFLGCWASLFYIFPRYIGDEFIKYFSPGESEFVVEFKENIFSSTLYKIGFNIDNITGIVMPVLLLAVIFRFLSVFVCLWALIHTTAFIILIIQILRKARSSDS